MQKTVGIVTIIDYLNYGNRLQNIAVKKLVGDMGYTAVNLDIAQKKYFEGRGRINKVKHYIPPQMARVLDSYRVLKRHGLKNMGMILRRRKKFKQFSDKYIKTDRYVLSDKGIMKPEIDENKFCFFTCGSDQIWNPYFAGDSRFFLEFVNTKKKIAISASIGLDELPDFYVEDFEKGVRHLDLISVREKAAVDIINQYSDSKASFLYDPTLLAGKEFWKSLLKKPNVKLPKHYIVSFFIGELPLKAVAEYKKILNMPVIILNNLRYPSLYSIAPDELLYIIKNADLIITDSFHIMAFSIIFRKQFYVFERVEKGARDMFSRMRTILEDFGLEDRKYSGEVVIERKITDETYDRIEDMINVNKQQFIDRLKGLIL